MIASNPRRPLRVEARMARFSFVLVAAWTSACVTSDQFSHAVVSKAEARVDPAKSDAQAMVTVTLALIGTGIGVLGSIGLMRVLNQKMAIVPGNDPWVIVGVAALLISVALLACWLPARSPRN